MSISDYERKLKISRFKAWADDMLKRTNKSLDELQEIYFSSDPDLISDSPTNNTDDEVRPLGRDGGACTSAVGAKGPQGLFKSHIRTDSTTFRNNFINIHLQANLVEFIHKRTQSQPLEKRESIILTEADGSCPVVLVDIIGPEKVKGERVRGKRKEVNGLSSQSRRRMKKDLNKLIWTVPPVWVGLTEPGEFGTPKESKVKFHRFKVALRRRWPSVAGFWRFDLQKRGAPHYHVYLFNVPYEELRKYLDEMWFKAVGSGDIKHLNAGVNCKQLDNSWKHRAYTSKYMSKVPAANLPSWTGRCWGYINKKNLPWSSKAVLPLVDQIEVKMKRALRHYTHVRHNGVSFFFVKNPERWARLWQFCWDAMSERNKNSDEVPF